MKEHTFCAAKSCIYISLYIRELALDTLLDSTDGDV